MNNNDVIIVIPVYCDPKNTELISFYQCCNVLGHYPIALLHPESYKGSFFMEKLPTLIDCAMDDKWFKSVASYNELLLTPTFYEHFSSYKYMLIYQLDAFVFRDELRFWVDKGYDYIGAPWIPNDKFVHHTIGRFFDFFKRKAVSTRKATHSHMHYKVGNGGFSLRRIEKMIEVLRLCEPYIETIPSQSKARQEDVFISVVVRKKMKIKVPKWKDALKFSFENAPDYCYRKLGGKLPFGCHYWPSERNRTRFWNKYIPQSILRENALSSE